MRVQLSPCRLEELVLEDIRSLEQEGLPCGECPCFPGGRTGGLWGGSVYCSIGVAQMAFLVCVL